MRRIDTATGSNGHQRGIGGDEAAETEPMSASLADASLADVVRELRALRSTLVAGHAELLTAAQAARFLGVGRSTFYRIVAAELGLKPVRMAGGKRWRRADLQAYVDRLRA